MLDLLRAPAKSDLIRKRAIRTSDSSNSLGKIKLSERNSREREIAKAFYEYNTVEEEHVAGKAFLSASRYIE